MVCDIHSADRIVPKWQDVGVGDQVKLHPEVALEVDGGPGTKLTASAGSTMNRAHHRVYAYRS